MKNFYFFIFFTFLLTFAFNGYAQNQTQANPKALSLMSRGDFRGAIDVLDKDIAKSKNLFESYKLRAMVRNMIGDFTGALSDFDKAIELKTDDGEIYENRVWVRMALQQDYGLLIKDLDSAVSNGRKHEKVYSLRATIRRQQGDEDGAIADYQAAIGLRPDYAQPYVGLSSIYAVGKDNEKAIAILENFISQIENSGSKVSKVKGEVTASNVVMLPKEAGSNVQVMQGTVITKGEFRLSGPPSPEQIDKMEQSKNIALAYINLASLYEQQKDYEKALMTIEKGLRIDPTHFYGYEMRGRIKIGTGDYAGAITDLNKSISIMPNMGVKYLDRGIAYLMLGKTAEAQADFDKHLQMFPKGKENLDKRIAEAKKRLEQ